MWTRGAWCVLILCSSLAPGYYLKEEPGALVALAGICAGGAGQPAFLPRPWWLRPLSHFAAFCTLPSMATA